MNVRILVCLLFCCQVCCGRSPVESKEPGEKIEEFIKLLTERNVHNDDAADDVSAAADNDDELSGDHGVRIVGGQPASPGEYTWMVSLYENGDFFCGGSIVDERTILTAAHCVENTPSWATVWVRAGDYKTQKMDDTEQRIKVKNIISHWKYNRNKVTYDIAILKLNFNLDFNDYVQPIAIPGLWREKNVRGLQDCWLSGFGQFKEPAVKFPWVLQEADTTLKAQTFCKNTVDDYYNLPYNTKYQICSYDNGFGACPGDSGGPFVCYDGNKVPYQLGIVSWGSTICAEGFNVYTRVARYTKWIERYSG